MRIMVLFDLPTGSAKERRAYSDFRKYLINDGFTMEQYNVYSRVTDRVGKVGVSNAS